MQGHFGGPEIYSQGLDQAHQTHRPLMTDLGAQSINNNILHASIERYARLPISDSTKEICYEIIPKLKNTTKRYCYTFGKRCCCVILLMILRKAKQLVKEIIPDSLRLGDLSNAPRPLQMNNKATKGQTKQVLFLLIVQL